MMLNSLCRKPLLLRRLAFAVCLFLLTATEINQVCEAGNTELAGEYYERAVMKYREGDIKSAIIELKNAIQQNPAYLAAQILLAEVYLKDKNLIATEVALSQADKLGGDPALMVMTRAQLYLYQLKYSQLIQEIIPEKFARNLQPDLHIFRGHAYLQLNQLSQALNEYETAAQIASNRIEPVIGRANVLLRLGNMQGAINAADQAAAMQPDSAESWYIKASIKHVQGRLKEALEDYGQAVTIDPQHLEARIARSGVLMDLRRDDEAEADLAYLRETYPFDAKVAYLHSVVLARNSREKEAVEALTAAAEALDSVKPEFLAKHAQSLMLSGLVNFSLKRFDIAMHYLELYIQNYPNQAGPYKLLATILLDRGENEQVIKLLSPVLAIAPNDYRLLFTLGRAYMQNGQHDEANALLEKAAKLNVRGADIQTELGLNRMAMGQYELASDELEVAVDKDPGNSKAGIPLVYMNLNRDRPEEALRIAVKMYERQPENLTLLNLLGTVQVRAGRRDLARQSFNKAIASQPDFITPYVNLSKLDVLEKKSDSAKERLLRLIEKYPENVTLLIELARIFEIEGDNESASGWLEKAVKTDSQSIAARLAMVDMKLKTGRYPEALNLALEAQRQDRENLQVMEALARSFIANGNKSKAVGILKNMSRNAGFNAIQLHRIAMMQFAVDDREGAIKSLKNAISGNENYIPARIMLAEAELQFGKEIFARNQADFLLQRYPELPHGHRLLGDIATHEKKFKQAAEHYQAAFNIKQNTYLLLRLYAALKLAGENKQAFQLIEQWVAEHDADAEPVQALAEEYLVAGRFQDARKYYEQLVERFQNRPDLLNNLAYIYFNLGDDRALSYAEQAQQLAPEHSGANDTLGWILVNKGQPERGLHYLRNAHARSSQDPEIRYHIAFALYRLQRHDEAKVELKEALRTNPSFNGSEQAKKLLEKLSR